MVETFRVGIILIQLCYSSHGLFTSLYALDYSPGGPPLQIPMDVQENFRKE